MFVSEKYLEQGGSRSNLIREKPPIHPQIRTDVLIDGPRELRAQSPGHERHGHGADAQKDRDEKQFDIIHCPDLLAERDAVRRAHDGLLDFAQLQDTVGEQSKVANTQADQLESILAAQGIIREQRFVEQGKDIKTHKSP